MSDIKVYDKAKWHFEGNYPAELGEENAYTHAGYFFGWIVDHDLVEPGFLADFQDEITQFRGREIGARRLFQIMDGRLVSDMMDDTGNAFATDYFDGNAYLDDYEDLLVGSAPTMYHVNDTPENYAAICARIDERFVMWQADRYVMKLEFESGVVVLSPTEDDFARIEGEEFAILSRDDHTYIQCAEQNEPPWEYVLEYQDGSIDQHYSAADGPVLLDRVVAAFKTYLNGDESWRTGFQWEKMDLS